MSEWAVLKKAREISGMSQEAISVASRDGRVTRRACECGCVSLYAVADLIALREARRSALAVPDDESTEIVALWEAGVRAKDIATKLRRPVETVYFHIRTARDKGTLVRPMATAGIGQASRPPSAYKRKLTEADVVAIRASEATNTAEAQKYGVTVPNIYAIRTRLTWRHVP